MRFESAGETKRQTQIRPLIYGKAIEGVKLTALTSFPELPVLTVLQTTGLPTGHPGIGKPPLTPLRGGVEPAEVPQAESRTLGGPLFGVPSRPRVSEMPCRVLLQLRGD